MFLLGNLSDITVSKTTQKPFLLRPSLTAQKIDPLAVENIYNKLKRCERHVRNRVSQGQTRSPQSIKDLPWLYRVAERILISMYEYAERSLCQKKMKGSDWNLLKIKKKQHRYMSGKLGGHVRTFMFPQVILWDPGAGRYSVREVCPLWLEWNRPGALHLQTAFALVQPASLLCPYFSPFLWRGGGRRAFLMDLCGLMQRTEQQSPQKLTFGHSVFENPLLFPHLYSLKTALYS